MPEPITPRARRLADLRAMRKRIDDEITVLEAAEYDPSRRSPKQVPECGTESGYQAHRHRGEDCPRCRAAHAKHERVASARRRVERLRDDPEAEAS